MVTHAPALKSTELSLDQSGPAGERLAQTGLAGMLGMDYRSSFETRPGARTIREVGLLFASGLSVFLSSAVPNARSARLGLGRGSSGQFVCLLTRQWGIEY